MLNAPPLFSIVIPTYNRPERLRDCLGALAKLQYPRDRYEVVVIDDGGSVPLDSLADAVRSDVEVKLLRQENRGPAAARNTGAAHAMGTVLAFTDDDCRPDPMWLQGFARRMQHTPDHMLGGRTVNALTENIFASTSQRLIDYLYRYYNETAESASFFTSNNIAVPKELYLSLGGFATTFRRAAGEDREFCDRWLHEGRRMDYVPEAVVYHAHDLGGRTFWVQHFNYGRAAYDFHRNRLRRRGVHMMPEPIRFYLDLLRFPFEAIGVSRAWKESVLLGISQLANATGFFWEKLRSH